jgi:hypothetical protein
VLRFLSHQEQRLNSANVSSFLAILRVVWRGQNLAVGARPPQTSAQRREQAKQAAFIWEGSVDLFTNVTVSQESAGVHLVHDWMWVFLARHNIF